MSATEKVLWHPLGDRRVAADRADPLWNYLRVQVVTVRHSRGYSFLVSDGIFGLLAVCKNNGKKGKNNEQQKLFVFNICS